MKPVIDHTDFGSISVGGKTIDHDIVIRLNGKVIKRKKKLSKTVYGTSHILSIDEAQFIYETGVESVIIGSGQEGALKLSAEAQKFFDTKGCRIKIQPTPQAILAWNKAQGSIIGLFHVTC